MKEGAPKINSEEPEENPDISGVMKDRPRIGGVNSDYPPKITEDLSKINAKSDPDSGGEMKDLALAKLNEMIEDLKKNTSGGDVKLAGLMRKREEIMREKTGNHPTPEKGLSDNGDKQEIPLVDGDLGIPIIKERLSDADEIARTGQILKEKMEDKRRMGRDTKLRSLDEEVRNIEGRAFQTPENRARLEEIRKEYRRIENELETPPPDITEKIKGGKAEMGPKKVFAALTEAEREAHGVLEARTPQEHRNFILGMSEKYRKLPLWKKLSIGGGLMGIGLVGVGVGGAVGGAVAGSAFVSGRILSGLGMFATMDALTEKKIKNKYLRRGVAGVGAVAYGFLVPKIFAALDQELGLTEKAGAAIEWAGDKLDELFPNANELASLNPETIEESPSSIGENQNILGPNPENPPFIVTESPIDPVGALLRDPSLYGDINAESPSSIGENQNILGPNPENPPFIVTESPIDPVGALLRDLSLYGDINAVNAEISPLPTYEVKSGDTLYSILKTQFPEIQELSGGRQVNAIENILAEMEKNPTEYGVTSGDLDKINPGENINIEKIHEIIEQERIGGENIIDHAKNLPLETAENIESHEPSAPLEEVVKNPSSASPETNTTTTPEVRMENEIIQANEIPNSAIEKEYDNLANTIFNNSNALHNPDISNFIEQENFEKIMLNADTSQNGFVQDLKVNLSTMLDKVKGTPAFDKMATIVGYQKSSFMGIFGTERFGVGIGEKSVKTILEEIARFKIEQKI